MFVWFYRKPRPHAYKVVLCGASGHNVRSKPSLKAPPIGMLVLGNTITVTDHVIIILLFFLKLNDELVYLLTEKTSTNFYCHLHQKFGGDVLNCPVKKKRKLVT